MTIGLLDESNVHNWEIIMDGPEGSPYVVRIDLLLSDPPQYDLVTDIPLGRQIQTPPHAPR
jgi:hypothetical protein